MMEDRGKKIYVWPPNWTWYVGVLRGMGKHVGFGSRGDQESKHRHEDMRHGK